MPNIYEPVEPDMQSEAKCPRRLFAFDPNEESVYEDTSSAASMKQTNTIWTYSLRNTKLLSQPSNRHQIFLSSFPLSVPSSPPR